MKTTCILLHAIIPSLIFLVSCEIKKPDVPVDEGNKITLEDPVFLEKSYNWIDLKTYIYKLENQEILQHGFCWNRHGGPVIDGDENIRLGRYYENEDGSYVTHVGGLEPFTDYYFRAFVVYNGIIIYSDEIIIKTRRLSDYDDNIYNTVRIGEQVWMAENLKSTHYANGTPVPNGIVLGTDLPSVTQKYYFSYSNDDGYISDYGLLYTWGAVMNDTESSNDVPSRIQGICPDGWHVPSDKEWIILEDFLGGKNNAGNKLKEVGNDHWITPNDATNESGFTALPGGNRDENGFNNIGLFGRWWTTTSDPAAPNACLRSIYWDYPGVSRDFFPKQLGNSVRCVMD